MENLQILVNVTVDGNPNKSQLRQRIADQLRKIANPVREDEGITTVNSVTILNETATPNQES